MINYSLDITADFKKKIYNLNNQQVSSWIKKCLITHLPDLKDESSVLGFIDEFDLIEINDDELQKKAIEFFSLAKKNKNPIKRIYKAIAYGLLVRFDRINGLVFSDCLSEYVYYKTNDLNQKIVERLTHIKLLEEEIIR